MAVRPGVQAVLAEVSLTFENTKNLLPTEFNMGTVTRKFIRAGKVNTGSMMFSAA